MSVLAEAASRSSQADAVILLAAVGCISLLFSLLALVADWMDRRAWRRSIHEAHRANGRRRGTA